MAMRPEDIEALLAQMGQSGGNPLANAIGKYSGQQPGLGAGALPQTPNRAAAPMPMPTPAPMPDDEAMLGQVQEGMGEEGGDMQADADALVEMYANGDPSDPATLEQWRVAKDSFIQKWGEENLPDLPNDPEGGQSPGDYDSADMRGTAGSERRREREEY